MWHNPTLIPIQLIFFVSFSPSIRTVVYLIKVKNINVLCVFFTAHGPDKVGAHGPDKVGVGRGEARSRVGHGTTGERSDNLPHVRLTSARVSFTTMHSTARQKKRGA